MNTIPEPNAYDLIVMGLVAALVSKQGYKIEEVSDPHFEQATDQVVSMLDNKSLQNLFGILSLIDEAKSISDDELEALEQADAEEQAETEAILLEMALNPIFKDIPFKKAPEGPLVFHGGTISGLSPNEVPFILGTESILPGYGRQAQADHKADAFFLDPNEDEGPTIDSGLMQTQPPVNMLSRQDIMKHLAKQITEARSDQATGKSSNPRIVVIPLH